MKGLDDIKFFIQVLIVSTLVWLFIAKIFYPQVMTKIQYKLEQQTVNSVK